MYLSYWHRVEVTLQTNRWGGLQTNRRSWTKPTGAKQTLELPVNTLWYLCHLELHSTALKHVRDVLTAQKLFWGNRLLGSKPGRQLFGGGKENQLCVFPERWISFVFCCCNKKGKIFTSFKLHTCHTRLTTNHWSWFRTGWFGFCRRD